MENIPQHGCARQEIIRTTSGKPGGRQSTTIAVPYDGITRRVRTPDAADGDREERHHDQTKPFRYGTADGTQPVRDRSVHVRPPLHRGHRRGWRFVPVRHHGVRRRARRVRGHLFKHRGRQRVHHHLRHHPGRTALRGELPSEVGRQAVQQDRHAQVHRRGAPGRREDDSLPRDGAHRLRLLQRSGIRRLQDGCLAGGDHRKPRHPRTCRGRGEERDVGNLRNPREDPRRHRPRARGPRRAARPSSYRPNGE